MQPEGSAGLRLSAATLRRALGRDAPVIAALAAEHAGYERSQAAPDVRELARALEGPSPRLWVWIAEDHGEPLGYASATEEFSTWRALPHLHLDCLFVREGHRSRGLGATLFRQVQQHAREQGIRRLEWQTPQWNGDAIRFYERMGGRCDIKARFSLAW